jgi:pyridoxamine 5'-phosphate oxidase
VTDPAQILERWLGEAREAEAPTPAAMTLATVGDDGRPSARVVSLKRLEAGGALVFATGLWTRKSAELRANPQVAVVFHWPTLGRQARIEGRATIAERKLAEELFAERPKGHQLQALASRQGEAIEDLASLRSRLDELESQTEDQAIPCPTDWGAVRVTPEAIELWTEADDRLHERRLFERGDDGWSTTLLSP